MQITWERKVEKWRTMEGVRAQFREAEIGSVRVEGDKSKR